MIVAEPKIALERETLLCISLAGKIAPYLAAALLLAVPCLWQPHIQASDLGSHLYNAWLANRSAVGALKGLYVVPQYSNVLFDLCLSWLLKHFSVAVTERIAVISAVQIFFWGCFALVSATGGRPAWRLAPVLTLLTFGAVFRMGFFNFYISVGICCAAIGLVWWNDLRARWLAVPLLAVAWIAHLLPCLWAALAIGYILAARSIAPSRRWWLLAAGLVAIGGLAAFLASHVPSVWTPGFHIGFSGADQALTFGAKYLIIAAGLFCWSVLLLVHRFESDPRPQNNILLHLWILMAVACVALPDSIWLPFYAGGLAYITLRLSLLSAILLCAYVARTPAKLAETICQVALLAVFLAFSFTDERALNLVEQKVARTVAALPPDSRVIATLQDSRLYVPALQHVADRPCIGRCFDFSDYEPSTGQFRLRAQPGNSFALTDPGDIDKLEHHKFSFQRKDLKLYRIFPCKDGRDVCADLVSPGQELTKVDMAAQ